MPKIIIPYERPIYLVFLTPRMVGRGWPCTWNVGSN